VYFREEGGGLAMVVGTEVDVEVFGERVGAVVSSEPLYDAAGSRIRA
jgi:hypothetical protein